MTTLYVQRHYKSAGQDEKLSDDLVESLEIQDFVVTPAKIRLELGVTLNTGNYESARITVGVEVPCYREEINEAYSHWMEFVQKKVVEEQALVKEWALNRGAKNNLF